ncbi:MAG: HEAT repeat domain-containing protein, partial [Endomicrobia bacterium]|nr:HEAT repeat domain-containing protein [Endomicrobiia bacterium]
FQCYLSTQQVDKKEKVEKIEETAYNKLKSENEIERMEAIQLLSKLQSEDSVKALSDAYKKEKKPYLRIAIIDSLSIKTSTTALEVIISALDDENSYVRQQAAITLGYYGEDEKIISSLGSSIDKEKDDIVKLSIINTLGQKRSSIAIANLSKGLKKNNSKTIRLFTIEKLKKIGTKEAMIELEKYETDPDPEIREKIKRKKK